MGLKGAVVLWNVWLNRMAFTVGSVSSNLPASLLSFHLVDDSSSIILGKLHNLLAVHHMVKTALHHSDIRHHMVLALINKRGELAKKCLLEVIEKIFFYEQFIYNYQ